MCLYMNEYGANGHRGSQAASWAATQSTSINLYIYALQYANLTFIQVVKGTLFYFFKRPFLAFIKEPNGAHVEYILKRVCSYFCVGYGCVNLFLKY